MQAVEEQNSLLSQLPLLIAEARTRRLPLIVVFAAIALFGLVLGMVWPKKYESSATILVQEDNIIQPLMEGRAVTTSVVDRAKIAREVLFSRKIMSEVLGEGGWLASGPTPLEVERIAELVKSRTKIAGPGPNLIQIVYEDKDPERTFRVAKKYADAFIAESLATKERESREAYEFIAARVEEYHSKLTQAEEKLKQFRGENQDARPGSAVDVNTRVAELRSRIESAQTEVSELQMRERELGGQLSGESESSGSQSREAQFRTRMGELQVELDRLLLSYTDSYPDVVRVRHQMDDLKNEIAGENARRERARAAGVTGAGAEAANLNPVYLQLRTEVNKVRSDSAALRARISETEELLQAELDRGRRVADSEATLAELTRDYEVNRDIYQDLLKRRENARVSMSLDAEHRGLTFRIQEPAALPLQPSGPRFIHFAAAGILLGAILPLGLLWLLVRFDPRVRSAAELARELSVPVLVSIARQDAGRARERERMRSAIGAAIVLLVLLTYGVVGWLRYTRMS